LSCFNSSPPLAASKSLGSDSRVSYSRLRILQFSQNGRCA
jgi:hypothetical protein